MRSSSPVVQQETYLYQPVVPQPGAVEVGLMYPAPYQIAMSSLGYLTLFKQLDQNPNVAVERVYTDTLKQHEASQMELMGFSFSFELDMVSILSTLDYYQIPLYAEDRSQHEPLIFAGGPVPMSNPEPFAPFFDFFLIGEGEEMLDELVKAYQQFKDLPRKALLHRLAIEVPGLYAPSLYQVIYDGPEGAISDIIPEYPDIPAVVQKRLIANMDDFAATTPILATDTIFADRFLVEVMRGCAHRCRFCLASYSMLPARGPSIEPIIQEIERGLKYTSKIGLLGALISNHPNFPELCEFLNAQDGLSISAASLRADTLTPQIAATFKKGQQRQLTIAVESGSEKLRRRINKNLKHEQIMTAAANVAGSGLKGLKLYGMVGLPDETEDDVVQLADLVKTIKKEHPKLELHLGCSSFVPKAGTPFQWMAKQSNKTVETRFEILRKSLFKTADFRPSSPRWDYFQAFLSRGDRRLAPLLVRFYQLGGSLGSLKRAYKEMRDEGQTNLPRMDWYALRERPFEEILPWDMINLGVSKSILYKEGLPPPPTTTPLT